MIMGTTPELSLLLITNSSPLSIGLLILTPQLYMVSNWVLLPDWPGIALFDLVPSKRLFQALLL